MRYWKDSKHLLGLKARICGFAHVAKSISKDASKKHGDARAMAKMVRKSLQYDNRLYLVAYGLIRGIPYRKIEPKCALENRLNPRAVAATIRAFVPWNEQKQWSDERVAELLTVGDSS